MLEWLSKKRIEAGLTQAEVARRAGIAQPSYYAIESGKSKPKPETAMKLGKILHFPWTRFYEEDNDNDEKAVP